MQLRDFESLPASSKLWVVALSLPLTETQAKSLEQSLENLLSHWAHKGQHYAPAYSILFNQVILIAEESMAHEASGCAIDGLMRKFGMIVTSLSLKVVNPTESILWTNDHKDLRISSKSDIPHLIAKKELKATSLIADFGLETLEQLATQGLFRICSTTWLGRKYFQDAVSTVN